MNLQIKIVSVALFDNTAVFDNEMNVINFIISCLRESLPKERTVIMRFTAVVLVLVAVLATHVRAGMNRRQELFISLNDWELCIQAFRLANDKEKRF